MSDYSVRLANLGKMYRLYRRPVDKVLDALGLGGWRRKEENAGSQDFWALRDTTLDIRKGERVGIIGRNGAGKSTLLKIICGTTKATEGRLEVHGTIQALMELGTGFHPEFTGRENIRSALAYQGFTSAQIDNKMDEIIDFSELDDFIEQPIRTYSAGMYARLAFATATSVEPDLLVIDEILGAGDAYFTGKCIERMRNLTERSGATVLFVSHDSSSVQRLCPRAIWIDRGRIKGDGDSLEVIKDYSAAVRQEEELRLRARDMKLRKKQAGSMETREDLYHELLFHLVPADGAPMTSEARIYGVRLLRGEQEIAAIAVGGPMDNSVDFENHLMTDAGFMDWGAVGADGRGAFRTYGNFGGRYAHAPFKLAIPRTFDFARAAAWTLEISYTAEKSVAVELFWGTRGDGEEGGAYHRIGLLAPDAKIVRLPCPLAELAAAPAGAPADLAAPELKVAESKGAAAATNSDEYGSREARITAVRMYNSGGVETRVFEMGQPMRIEMDYQAERALVNPVFVFCVYLPDGQCASQYGFSALEVKAESIAGSGKAIFHLANLNLGRSAYVASAAIFKRLRTDELEAESYHVLDRCIHFQVIQPAGESMSRGLCLQPFKGELIHG